MDNYDRSRDYALWKNVHWEPIKGGARVVYIDQNSCLAQRRFSPDDKNKFYGLCRYVGAYRRIVPCGGGSDSFPPIHMCDAWSRRRFRRSMVARLRQLVGKLGKLTYRSVRKCDAYPDHVSLLSGMTPEQAMYVYDDLDSRLETALGVIDACIEKYGEDMVLSLP